MNCGLKYKSIVREGMLRRHWQSRTHQEITAINRDQTPIAIKYDETYQTPDGELIPIKVYRQGSAMRWHWQDTLPRWTAIPSVRSMYGG